MQRWKVIASTTALHSLPPIGITHYLPMLYLSLGFCFSPSFSFRPVWLKFSVVLVMILFLFHVHIMQAVVTSHLVLRGSYRSLTLVVYGNTAEDLGQFNIDFDLDNSLANVVSSPCDGKFEDLPPPLCPTKFSLDESLSSLGILSYSIPILELTPQMRQFLLLIMKICQVSDKEALSELVKVVVSVVSSYVKNDNNIANSWGRQNVGMLVDNKLAQHHLLADASSQLCKLYKHHQSAMEINQLLEDDFVLGTESDIPSSKLLMDVFHQCFPLMGKTSVLKHPHVSQVILTLSMIFSCIFSRKNFD